MMVIDYVSFGADTTYRITSDDWWITEPGFDFRGIPHPHGRFYRFLKLLAPTLPLCGVAAAVTVRKRCLLPLATNDSTAIILKEHSKK